VFKYDTPRLVCEEGAPTKEARLGDPGGATAQDGGTLQRLQGQ